MRIAVATDKGVVSQHFGHSPEMTVYEIQDGRVISKDTFQMQDRCGDEQCGMAGFLSGKGIDLVVAGGMGDGANARLSAMGIKTVGGAAGADADSLMRDFAEGRLTLAPPASCGCGGHEHHGEEHGHGGTCGHGHGHGNGHGSGVGDAYGRDH